MAEKSQTVLKGALELEIDQAGLEAALVFSPDPGGAEWDRQKACALLEEQGIREGIDSKALESLFIPENAGATCKITVARGTPPQPGLPAKLSVETLPVPEALQPYQQKLLPADRPPEVYRRTVKKTKSERIITKKPKLPFLTAKVEKEVVWEKTENLTPLDQPGEEQGRGYAHKGDVVGTIAPGQRARAGRDVFGKEIPAEASEAEEGVYLGGSLKQIGSEIRVETGGFFRYGSNWIELFPFSLHEHKVYTSNNKLTCLLDFVPGSNQAAPPTAEQVLEESQELGFTAGDLLDVEEVARLLSRALTDKTPLKSEPLSRAADAEIRVEIAEDKLSARVTLSKGRGKGKPLRLKEIGEVIRNQKLKGMDIPRVQEDILEFHRGQDSRLESYLLAEGREAERGEDGRIDWKISFLPSKRAERLKEQISGRPDQLEEFASLEQFPIDAVEAMAEVQERATVAEIVPATTGAAGVDVFGAVRPGVKGQDVRLKLFENLKRVGNEIVAMTGGLLEKGSQGEALYLRVRPHQNREIQVSLAEDRMQAFLTLLPSEGTGEPLDPEAVNRVITEAGVVKGLQPEVIAEAYTKAQGGEKVDGVLIAQGRAPLNGQDTDLEIVVQLASGQRVTVKEDGRADYRRQDTITTVKADTLLARLNAPTLGTDGWDVTGKPIPARRGSARYVHVGKNVECREQEDGSLEYFAKIEGELDYRGSAIDVLQVHTLDNVGLESGNVKFPGTVRVMGSVQGGFIVMSGENILVEESVQGALLSAGGSIRVEKGIVGEGKAVLRAKSSIRAHFAEQATLLAVEDIHLTNACLRCTVKCNGRMILESEKGNIIGGRVYCKLGLEAMNIGSEREVNTEIHFGQDILVQDHLEREQQQSEALKKRNTEIERSITRLKRTAASDLKGLEVLRAGKRRNLQQIQMHSKRIFILQERFEQHFPSEIAVRGVVYPGVVLNSHGRRREIKTALREVVFYFNTTTGRIEEKPLSG